MKVGILAESPGVNACLMCLSAALPPNKSHKSDDSLGHLCRQVGSAQAHMGLGSSVTLIYELTDCSNQHAAWEFLMKGRAGDGVGKGHQFSGVMGGEHKASNHAAATIPWNGILQS